jgi:hypothetical protein
MKSHLILLSSLCAALACSCASKIDAPKGKSKGYSSARFVKSDATTAPQGLEDSPVVNQMVKDAISSEFSKNGVPVGGSGSDLIIAFMLVRQETSMTTMNTDHFGHGRDAGAILEKAHDRGVIENKSPDDFKSGAILIDVLDARSNELVFRNFAKRSITEGISDDMRKQRIAAVVAEALAPFFK